MSILVLKPYLLGTRIAIAIAASTNVDHPAIRASKSPKIQTALTSLRQLSVGKHCVAFGLNQALDMPH